MPQEASSISVSLDRVSVPMEEPRKRLRGRPREGAPKKPVARVWRMAYVGCVTLHDKEGNALTSRRYGCMPGGDEQALCEGMKADVALLRQKHPDLKEVHLCDGAREMWNLLSPSSGEQPVTRLIDYWHLVEKLGPVAQMLQEAGGEQAGQVLERWKLSLLNSSRAARRILEELEDSGLEHVRRGEESPVHDAITYLRNGMDRMDYASARAAGLPIGSGNVEATCKSLVSVRMRRSGARWKHESGNDVLQLRALMLSDCWSHAMQLTLDPLRTSVPVRLDQYESQTRTEYGYDEMDRLTGTRTPEGRAVLYRLDAVGNRTGERKTHSEAAPTLGPEAYAALPLDSLRRDVPLAYNRADWLRASTHAKAPERTSPSTSTATWWRRGRTGI